MNQTDSDRLSSEWKSFQDERKTIIEKSKKLNQELNVLSNHPLQKNIVDLKKMSKHIRTNLADHKESLRNTKIAFTSLLLIRQASKTDKQIEEIMNLARKSEFKIKKGGSQKTYDSYIKLIHFQLTAPLDKLTKYFNLSTANLERRIKKLKDGLKVIELSLSEVIKIYRTEKRRIKEAIRKCEEERIECRHKEIEWASRSHMHLEWILINESSYKQDAVRRYKIRFPDDDLSDLIPPAPRSPAPAGRKKHMNRHDKSRTENVATPREVLNELSVWEFWVTFGENDVGIKLPQDREGFVQELQRILNDMNYHRLSAERVYDKLIKISRLTVADRQKIKQMTKKKGSNTMIGWKIERVGRKLDRLFLDIDENRRRIRFLPVPRKKSYGDH